MWIKEQKKRSGKLSRELLGLIALDFILSTGCYFFIRSWAGSFAYDYCEKRGIVLDELQTITTDALIMNLSVIGAVAFFVILFLIFVGRKLGYIRELTDGIHRLRTHRMQHEVPLVGGNELTELAASINDLAKTERQLKAIERNLSHDIRTPLTAILSYAEYMQTKETISQEELEEFLELIRRKAEQMKLLTEQLLDGGCRLTEIDDGKLLMTQLADEWLETLEEDFACQVNLSQCPDFKGQIDVEEIRRIFDNLSSNVIKYASHSEPVLLEIKTEKKHIVIRQSNGKATVAGAVESRKIGLSSIENIAKHHGGSVTVVEDGECFSVNIILFEV